MNDFRQRARDATARARRLLETNKEQDLPYAALELRMAMEALTYDRMNAYKREIPPSQYSTWQARKVMLLLLEIDPNADKDSSLHMGREESPGEHSKEMQYFGSEKVLNTSTLKKHYDALGSYLHVPTLKQVEDGDLPSTDKLRARCAHLINVLEAVLASSVFNVTLGIFASLECIECGAMIRKRVPSKGEVEATCFDCNATYRVKSGSDGQSIWTPNVTKVECANKECKTEFDVWVRELKPGNAWICSACQHRSRFVIGIVDDGMVAP